MKALMCVPNVSEGTDLGVVEKVVDTIKSAAGVMLLDYSSDGDHNRSVISYIGAPDPVVAATENLVKTAVDFIDMRTHKGSHPRQGAVDVVPFIPVRGISSEEGIAIARDFGKWVGNELEVPVYFYEDAATRPERQVCPRCAKASMRPWRISSRIRSMSLTRGPVSSFPRQVPSRSAPDFPWSP